MESREYHIALQYVRQEYRELYSFADDIVVIPGNRMPQGQEGQCSPDRFIVISSSLGTVGQYVNVLVHELTHAKQFATGHCKDEDAMEQEAYTAGILAAEQYLTKAAPWRTK